MTSKWSGGLVDWVDNGKVYLSVVFSWKLPVALSLCKQYRKRGYDDVVVGGPAIVNNPKYFEDYARVDYDLPSVFRHNPDATFTTRGCIRTCKFCIVHTLEPEYKELVDFDVRPIVCDNNFLACSKVHFDRTIDKLKQLKQVDFNQGLDARLMSKYKADRLAELDMKVVRLAWDNIKTEKAWMRAFEILIRSGFKPNQIRSYVLIGYNDTPEDALYRLEKIKSLGAYPNPMRYQPLDTPKRNAYVGPNWTDEELKKYMRYWSRLVWLEHIPFTDYNHHYRRSI